MGSNNRWNWEVAGFEPRKSAEQRDDYRRVPPVAPRRYSLSISSQSELSKHAVNSKFLRLNDKVKVSALLITFFDCVLLKKLFLFSLGEGGGGFFSVFMWECLLNCLSILS